MVNRNRKNEWLSSQQQRLKEIYHKHCDNLSKSHKDYFDRSFKLIIDNTKLMV